MVLGIPEWEGSGHLGLFRKRISGKPAQNFQLDLYQPDGGHSMVAAKKAVDERSIWLNGGGNHEHTTGGLKSRLAFALVVEQSRDANCAWQVLSGLIHSLLRAFQVQAQLARPEKELAESG